MAGGVGAPGVVAVGVGAGRRRRREPGGVGDPAVLATAAVVLGQIRKAKSEAKVSMRAEAARVIVGVPSPEAADAVRASEDDLRAAGNIADFSFVLVPGGELATEVTLAEPVTS